LNIDADCIASPLWVCRTVSYFAHRIGLVMGFTVAYNSNRSKSVFTNLQTIDMLFLMDSAAGAIGMNVPVSCMGSNLGYRRAVLDDLGDLRTGYTITEDTTLIQNVAKDTDWNITVAYHKDALVLTSAEEGLGQFLSQRIRWILGGQANRLWSLIPLYAVFLFNLCLVAGFVTAFFVQIFVSVVFFTLVKVVLDFIRCWYVCKEFERCDLLWLFIPYEVFMIFYSIVTGFGSIFIKKVKWKGEIYTRTARLR